jgi:hypothetical protein
VHLDAYSSVSLLARFSRLSPKKVPYNMETWRQDGLRYFVIGDASAADIDGIANLVKATWSQT